jgi:succinate dehydrogenase hydrophobic anchor subunit
LAELVEAAEHQRRKRRVEVRDFWWKRITAIAAITAAIASIAGLARHC